MNMTDDEIKMFENTKSEVEWGAACDAVKKMRGGNYPPDWWVTMKMSGRMDRILASFGSSSEIRVETISGL